MSIFGSLSRSSCQYLLHQTVKYIEKIPHVQTAVESSLYALGDSVRESSLFLPIIMELKGCRWHCNYYSDYVRVRHLVPTTEAQRRAKRQFVPSCYVFFTCNYAAKNEMDWAHRHGVVIQILSLLPAKSKKKKKVDLLIYEKELIYYIYATEWPTESLTLWLICPLNRTFCFKVSIYESFIGLVMIWVFVRSQIKCFGLFSCF